MNEAEREQEGTHALTSVQGLSGVGKTALVKEQPPQLPKSWVGQFAFVRAYSTVAKRMEISSVYDEVLAGLDTMTDKKYEWRKEEMVRWLQFRKAYAMVIDETLHLTCFGHPHTLLETLSSAKVVVLIR